MWIGYAQSTDLLGLFRRLLLLLLEQREAQESWREKQRHDMQTGRT